MALPQPHMNQLLQLPSPHHLSERLRLLCACFIEPCLFQGKPVSNRSAATESSQARWPVAGSAGRRSTQQLHPAALMHVTAA